MPETEQQIDVRKLSPQKKHPTIFETFEELSVGEAFVIINDHDPKPVGYQMAVVHGEEKFTWEYLQEGPTCGKYVSGKKPVNKQVVTVGYQ